MGSYSATAAVLILCVLTYVQISESYLHNKEPLNILDEQKYQDCSSLYRAGYNVSGFYRLTLYKDIMMPCEFDKNNGYNVVIQRVDNSTDFNRTYSDYIYGFGDNNGNYWAGLRVLHFLTNTGPPKALQMNMKDKDNKPQSVIYDHIVVGLADDGYVLTVQGYQGQLPDDLRFSQEVRFHTYDKPDPFGCAKAISAGWWFNMFGSANCSHVLPTGHYYAPGTYQPSGPYSDGIFYKDYLGSNYSLKFFNWKLYIPVAF